MSMTLGGLILLGLGALGQFAKENKSMVNATLKDSKVILKNLETDLKNEQGGFVPDDDNAEDD